MDARKIRFLIGIQREIDKLEEKDGNTPKIEKVKSRFYDVVEVKEVVNTSSQAKQDADKETGVSIPEVEGDTATADTQIQPQRLTPEQVEENQAWLAQLINERELPMPDEINTGIEETDTVMRIVGKQTRKVSGRVNTGTVETDTVISSAGIIEGELIRPVIRKRAVGVKKEIALIGEEVAKTKEILPAIKKNISDAKKNAIHISKDDKVKQKKNFSHKPKDVADFMKLFDSANDLKYLTHDFDEADKTFDIRTFLKKSKTTFDLYANKYTIPVSLWGIINQFAFDQNPRWSAIGKSVIEGWSSPAWIEWSESKGHPSKNRDFDNVIQSFKELTRVKSLQKIVESAIDKKFEDKKRLFNFTFIELDKADFYTHVGRLMLALSHLFDEICGRTDRPDVTIQYERQTVGDYRHRIIRIHHHDSYPLNKSIDEVFEKYRQHGGHLWEVREKLFGYCDWHIETIWDKQPVRVHLLREGMKANKVDVEVETLNSIPLLGFTHTLTFYFR